MIEGRRCVFEVSLREVQGVNYCSFLRIYLRGLYTDSIDESSFGQGLVVSGIGFIISLRFWVSGMGSVVSPRLEIPQCFLRFSPSEPF